MSADDGSRDPGRLEPVTPKHVQEKLAAYEALLRRALMAAPCTKICSSDDHAPGCLQGDIRRALDEK